jgi:hypothetical protein
LNSTIERIRREDGGSGGPDLVNVLNDDEGLADGLVGVDENGDFLVDGVGLEKELALGIKRLYNKLILNSFDVQGDLSPHHKWARPCTQKLHFTFRHNYHFSDLPKMICLSALAFVWMRVRGRERINLK